MPIFKMEGNFQNPWYRFLEDSILFLLTLRF